MARRGGCDGWSRLRGLPPPPLRGADAHSGGLRHRRGRGWVLGERGPGSGSAPHRRSERRDAGRTRVTPHRSRSERGRGGPARLGVDAEQLGHALLLARLHVDPVRERGQPARRGPRRYQACPLGDPYPGSPPARAHAGIPDSGRPARSAPGSHDLPRPDDRVVELGTAWLAFRVRGRGIPGEHLRRARRSDLSLRPLWLHPNRMGV